MADTGIAGYPTEAFDPTAVDYYCSIWGLERGAPFHEYLSAVIRNGTTANGIFGVKIQWSQISLLAKQRGNRPIEAFTTFFPDAKYIHLRRRDRRAQAISLYRAQGSNQWWKHRGPRSSHLIAHPEPAFDGDTIRQMEKRLEFEQNGWAQFFASAAIEPLHIECESLTRYRRDEVARVLQFLGQEGSVATLIGEPEMIPQADEKTTAWRKILDAEDAAKDRG